jgi:hypothetical protein
MNSEIEKLLESIRPANFRVRFREMNRAVILQRLVGAIILIAVLTALWLLDEKEVFKLGLFTFVVTVAMLRVAEMRNWNPRLVVSLCFVLIAVLQVCSMLILKFG